MFILNKAHARAFQGRIQKIPNGGGCCNFFFRGSSLEERIKGRLTKKKIVGKNPKQTNKQKLFPVKFVKDFSLIICRFL